MNGIIHLISNGNKVHSKPYKSKLERTTIINRWAEIFKSGLTIQIEPNTPAVG